eukprot:jgi/Antlo1/339/1558
MFVLTEIRDKVEIPVASKDKSKDIFIRFNKKYANKLIKNVGLGICIHSLKKIHHYRMKSELVMATVDFFVLVFKLYNNELLCGKITSQNYNGVGIELGFYGCIFVPKRNMSNEFEVLSKDTSSGKVFYWFWRYKGHKLYFINGEMARFKIKVTDKKLEGRIDETGLGPLSWWE